MKRGVLILLLASAVVLSMLSCKKFPFDNPLDPESEDYIGFESEDHDGDGIGQWEDVDEIELLSPVDGETLTGVPVCLITNMFNPDLIEAYWVQVATSITDFESSVIYSADDYTSNKCVVPSSVFVDDGIYYWRARASDSSKWSESWSEIESFVLDTRLNPPMSPYPSSGRTLPGLHPYLSWEDIDGALEYQIQVNTNDSFTGDMIADDNTLTKSGYWISTALSDNTTYYWHVRVRNIVGIWGDWSSTWSFTVDTTSSLIAFWSDRSGDKKIWLMNPDGTDPIMLEDLVSVEPTSWSPDRTKLATRAFFGDPDVTCDIMVCNADGSDETRLTYHPTWQDFHADWSPDGSKIMFSSDRDGNWEIYIMNADGSGQTNLTNHPAKDITLDWSPDGSKFVFASGRYGSDFYKEICIWEAGSVTRLTFNDRDDESPQWSPNGDKIVFVSDRDGAFNEEVYIMDIDGSNQTRLTDIDGHDAGPQWSPDGSKIVFRSKRDGDWEIYVMNPDGSDVVNLTNNTYSDLVPCW